MAEIWPKVAKQLVTATWETSWWLALLLATRYIEQIEQTNFFFSRLEMAEIWPKVAKIASHRNFMIFAKHIFNIDTKYVKYLAIFVEYLHNTLPTFALYVCNICTMFKQYLRNIHRIFLQYLHNISTLLEQYLHNIFIKFAKCIYNICTIFLYFFDKFLYNICNIYT